MKALLLAAGRGTRISRYLNGNPKCTVSVGDLTLIENTVRRLRRAGIHEIGIATGYRQEVIRDILKGYPIQFFYNPFYDVTNSIASAWFARDFIKGDEDILIMNADVFIEDSILDIIIAEQRSPVMLSDESRKEDGDYKFYYENEILMKYGKELTGKDITGEYVGIAKIGRAHVLRFVEKLEEMIRVQKHSVWWENVLYEDVDKYPVYIHNIQGKFWAEVDYIEDYERILNYLGYQLGDFLNVRSNET